jgi:hypothetical protein
LDNTTPRSPRRFSALVNQTLSTIARGDRKKRLILKGFLAAHRHLVRAGADNMLSI